MTHLSTIGSGETSTALDAKSADYNTLSSIDPINCSGYTKLLIAYATSSGWDRSGEIKIYGSYLKDTGFKLLNPTGTDISLWDEMIWDVDNWDFETSTVHAVGTSDDGKYYIAENIPPYIKLTWTRDVTGTTGTITTKIKPFNEEV